MKATALLAAICLIAPYTANAQKTTPAPETAAASAYDSLTDAQKQAVDAHVAICSQTTATVKEILTGINDRETADAAAPRLAAALKTLDDSWDALPDTLWPAVQEKIQPQKQEAEAVNGLIQGLLHAERPFYGSIALASTLGEVSTQNVNIGTPETAAESPITPEQQQMAEAKLQGCFDSITKLKAVMDTIQDKGSADVAAANLTTLMQDALAQSQEFYAWVDEEGLGEEIGAILQTRYADKMELIQSLDQKLNGLIEADFYGSDALKALFNRPEIEAVETDAE